jgi:hypothetical protein
MDKYEMLANELLPQRLLRAARGQLVQGLRDLVPGLEEWHLLSNSARGSDSPALCLAVTSTLLFQLAFHEVPPAGELEVRLVPLDDVQVSACREKLGLPGRLRTWAIVLPDDEVIDIETEQYDTEVSDSDERFVRRLARLKGWNVGHPDAAASP